LKFTKQAWIGVLVALGFANNTDNFRVEKKSPLVPARHATESEAARRHQAEESRAQRDIARYTKAVDGLLEEYKKQYGDRFAMIDYLKEYPVIDSATGSDFAAFQTSGETCSYRFSYKDYDKWMTTVTVTFRKLPDPEILAKLRPDIAKAISRARGK